MIREICIIVLAVCCIFSVIPSVSVFSNALSLLFPVCFLLIVLSYAGYDAKKLIDNGEHNLAKGFILFLIIALILSMVAVYFILPYTLPKEFVC
jgi:hypothetical protein